VKITAQPNFLTGATRFGATMSLPRWSFEFPAVWRRRAKQGNKERRKKTALPEFFLFLVFSRVPAERHQMGAEPQGPSEGT
jgi:hypothetical protein